MSENILKIIERLLIEAEMIKHKKPTVKKGKAGVEIWNNDCEDIINELKNIQTLYDIDPRRAIGNFRSLEISHYESFGDYIKSKNAAAAGCKFSTTAKQTKRKKCCPNCLSTKFEYDNSNGIYICSVCKTNIGKKQSNQLITKDTNNESKHIMKQINIISGNISNPPQQVIKVLPFINTWFVDKSHILEWLKYSGRYQLFIDKYYEETKNKIDESFFKEPLKYGIENLCSYAVFKMFTDEFYMLTDRVRSYNVFNSNVLLLTPEQQFELCNVYISKYGQTLPSDNFIFEYSFDGNPEKLQKYELGTYFIYWKINDIHFNNPIHQQLNKMFNQNIILPGLIFEYPEICGTKGKILQKYNYQQNYIFIIKNVYKIDLIEIIPHDKQKIIELMIDFNNFVKQLKSIEENKKHNACLWQVVLMLILKMPYYRCYSNIIPILPIKSLMTTLEIQEHWAFYRLMNKEKLKPYLTTLRTKVDNSTTAKTIICKEEVNINNVYNFINGKGEYFGADKEDKYLEEKLHIQTKKQDMIYTDLDTELYKSKLKNQELDYDFENESKETENESKENDFETENESKETENDFENEDDYYNISENNEFEEDRSDTSETNYSDNDW